MMEQTSTPPPPPEQQQQPPKRAQSSLDPSPPQSIAASTNEITPATSPAAPPTTGSSLSVAACTPTTTVAASSPALLSSSSSSSNHSQSISAPQPPLPTASQTNPLTRPPYNRPWQQQQPSPFAHYSLPPPLPSHSSSNTAANSSSTSLPVAPTPRGGMAIGVPAHHPGTPPSPPTSFSSLNPPSFGQPFSGLGRNVAEPGPASSSSQVRHSIGGMQGMGMMGSLGSSSAMRPQGLPTHQLRPVQIQQSLRPQSGPSTHSPSTQNFQGHGMLRVPSVGSPGSPSPSSTQSPQPQNQPWLSSGTQGKPPLPPTSLRAPLSSQSMPTRPHIAQPHQHSISAASQQQQASSTQQSQQPPTSASPQEQYGQQPPQSRIQQPLANQQQITRAQGSGVQRPHTVVPSTPTHPGVPSRTANAEAEETCNRILRKRSIQELVAQIDPSQKFDPEIDDILVDTVDDFVESIANFGVSLTKHRKSTTLEAKDILIPLERHWNIALPGFSGDEIKTYKKPLTSDIHRERLALIKKSIQAAEVTNSKSSAGQTVGNLKSHLGKGLSGPV